MSTGLDTSGQPCYSICVNFYKTSKVYVYTKTITGGRMPTELEKLIRAERREGTRTIYEWDIEMVSSYEGDDGDPDIDDHLFAFTLKEHKNDKSEREPSRLGKPYTWDWERLVLYRRQYVDWDLTPQWAYVTADGKMPEYFDGGTKVPKKYLAEFERNKAWASKLGDGRFEIIQS
jgi:hypothetical protein